MTDAYAPRNMVEAEQADFATHSCEAAEISQVEMRSIF
jgi:hypothetical protein